MKIFDAEMLIAEIRLPLGRRNTSILADLIIHRYFDAESSLVVIGRAPDHSREILLYIFMFCSEIKHRDMYGMSVERRELQCTRSGLAEFRAEGEVRAMANPAFAKVDRQVCRTAPYRRANNLHGSIRRDGWIPDASTIS